MITTVTHDNLPRAVEQLMSEFAELKAMLKPQPKPEPVKEVLLLDEAIQVLRELGRPVQKSTLYKEVCIGKIPHSKRGKRVIFSRKELTEWVNAGMPDQGQLEAADRLKRVV